MQPLSRNSEEAGQPDLVTATAEQFGGSLREFVPAWRIPAGPEDGTAQGAWRDAPEFSCYVDRQFCGEGHGSRDNFDLVERSVWYARHPANVVCPVGLVIPTVYPILGITCHLMDDKTVAGGTRQVSDQRQLGLAP